MFFGYALAFQFQTNESHALPLYGGVRVIFRIGTVVEKAVFPHLSEHVFHYGGEIPLAFEVFLHLLFRLLRRGNVRKRLIERRRFFALQLNGGELFQIHDLSRFEPVFHGRFQRQAAIKTTVHKNITPRFILHLRRDGRNLAQKKRLLSPNKKCSRGI